MGCRVAIHQPNYFPWLGYFAKIAAADAFVFLDDVQYSKNSYINRVKIRNGAERWLTVPVSAHLGDAIDAVRPAKPSWRRSHADLLANSYRKAAHRSEVLAIVRELLETAPDGSLAAINRFLVERVAALLGLECRFLASSEFDLGECAADDRLVALSARVAPDAFYVSGRGGAKYQDPGKFDAAGLGFGYLEFAHPIYAQGDAEFAPGLSVLDALFHAGVAGTGDLIRSAVDAA